MNLPTDNEFLRMVWYFFDEKGDPSRYCFWDEERFERLRPVEHHAWRQLVLAKATCYRLMLDLKDITDYTSEPV